MKEEDEKPVLENSDKVVVMNDCGGDGIPFKLGDRMKYYEKHTEEFVSDELPYIVRLDGHSFSKFTKGLCNPFDVRFNEAMNRTSKDVLLHFGEIDTVYVQSDEITLFVFPKLKKMRKLGEAASTTDNKEEEVAAEYNDYPFNGRIQKLVTIYASYVTARFNYHMSKLALIDSNNSYKNTRDNIDDEDTIVVHYKSGNTVCMYQPNVMDIACKPLGAKTVRRMTSHVAHFDGRIFQIPNEMECLNNLLWRLNYDCIRNSISKLACFHFSYKQNYKQNSTQKLQMLREEKNVIWDDLYPPFKYGCILKKEQYTKNATSRNNVGGYTEQEVVRTRIVVLSTKIDMSKLKESDEYKSKWIDFLKSRYVDEESKAFVLD